MKKKKKLGLSSDGVVKKYEKDGKTKVQGGPRLKETGEYPLKFCRKVAKWHTKFVASWTQLLAFGLTLLELKLSTGTHYFHTC